MNITTKIQTTDHPLEDVFDIERGTTEVITEEISTPLVVSPVVSYDEKDLEIEQQFQEVYDAAMTSFADQAGLLTQDPKFSARNMEVANAFLNTALAAAKEKASLKLGKEKNTTQAPKTVNNNLIMDRNELLKMMKRASFEFNSIGSNET